MINGEGVGYEIIDPRGISLVTLHNEQSGAKEVNKAEMRGDYAICIDNTYSMVHAKLESVYILTFQSNLMQKKIVEDKILNETSYAVLVNNKRNSLLKKITIK